MILSKRTDAEAQAIFDAASRFLTIKQEPLPIEDCDCEPTDWRCPHGE